MGIFIEWRKYTKLKYDRLYEIPLIWITILNFKVLKKPLSGSDDEWTKESV